MKPARFTRASRWAPTHRPAGTKFWFVVVDYGHDVNYIYLGEHNSLVTYWRRREARCPGMGRVVATGRTAWKRPFRKFEHAR